MFSIDEVFQYEETIKKSTFIGLFFPLLAINEVQNILNEVKNNYPAASHYPYAYIFGKDQEIFKYFDDKEPTKSAGFVIYDVLKKNKLTNCLCIVIRYFGGIKLGVGGLSRAYRNSVITVINKANLIPLIEWAYLSFSCPYEDWGVVESRLQNYQIVSKTFTTLVNVKIKLPKEEKDGLIAHLINLTNNRLMID